MSFSKTSIFCLILLMVFIAAPAMAHQVNTISTSDANGGYWRNHTFAENHDGKDNDPAGTTSSDIIALETNHTHLENAPKVTSVNVVNIETAAKTGPPAVPVKNSAVGRTVRPVDSATGDTIDFADISDTIAYFQIKVTFDKDVYDGPGAAASALALESSDFRFTAERRSNPGVDVGPNITFSSAAPVVTGTGNNAVTSKTDYNVTISINQTVLRYVLGDSSSDPAIKASPIDLYIRVNADAAYLRQRLVSGETTDGRASAESTLYSVTIIGALDETAPTLPENKRVVPTAPVDGNLIFSVESDEPLGSGANDLTADDVTVLIGTTAGTATVSKKGNVYTITVPVTTADQYKDVTVTIAKAGIKDQSGNALAADVVLTYEAPDEPDTAGPTVTITSKPDSRAELPKTGDMKDKVIFKFVFNEALGQSGDALGLGDITVTGGTKEDFYPVTIDAPEEAHELVVKPTNRTTDVTVTITGNVQDTNDNELDKAGSTPANATYIYKHYDKAPPTVSIGALKGSLTVGTGANAVTYTGIVFTFTFSEELKSGSFILDDISRGTDVLINSPLVMDANDKKVYRVVTNTTPSVISLTLKAGSVEDAARNALIGDQGHTYSTDDEPTDETEEPVVKSIKIGNQNTQAPMLLDSIKKDENVITVVIEDNEGLSTSDKLVAGDITANGGSISNFVLTETSTTVHTATFNVMPVHGEAYVTITVAANAVSDTASPANKNAAKSETFEVAPLITVPAGGFVVLVRHRHNSGTNRTILSDQPTLFDGSIPIPAQDITRVTWEHMPDLKTLFHVSGTGTGGGALILKGVTFDPEEPLPNMGDVIISEIMWATDIGILGNLTNDEQARQQWIELHNVSSAEAKVFIYARAGANIDSSTDVTNPSSPVVDVMTNRFDGSYGGKRWSVVHEDGSKGQDGNSREGENFVSMARTKDDKGVYKNGRAAGSWGKSTVPYYRAVTQDLEKKVYEYIGTPGRENTFSPAGGPITRDTRTNVPSSPVIFNEIGNRSSANSAYEWIELRNVTNGNVNVGLYTISMVTAVGTDKVLYRFPNSGVNIPAGGVLLLVASDPYDNPDHPISVGYNIDKNPEDQVRGLGVSTAEAANPPWHKNTPRYKVTPFQEGGLPDDGNFVLILRRPDNNDLSKNDPAETGANDLDKIVDIAGYHPDLKKTQYSNAVSKTDLWPLRAFGAAGFGHNKLEVNQVHARVRQHTADGRSGVGANANKAGETAFANAGFTGIGYKRGVLRSNVLGGDPGYHGILQNQVTQLADNHTVVISEMMLAQGPDNRKLPQWIELHNTSRTQAVNLAADAGWRLIIELESSNRVIGGSRTINFKKKGNVKVIEPNETVLIVSATARAYGSSTLLRSSTIFPTTRVYNVWKEQRTDFGMANQLSPIIKVNGFHLRLVDGKGNTADEVGNLDGNLRSADEPKWAYPTDLTDEGFRSSLIRIYDNGMPRTAVNLTASNVRPLGGDGTKGEAGIAMKYSWIHAADTDFKVAVFTHNTWWGAETDIGTPIQRAGAVLPVELSAFQPTLEDGKVVVRWTTESELDNAGFNIYRSETRDGEFKQVNAQLVEGAGTTGERNAYEWVDTTAKPDVVYYYQIEDVSFSGERQTLAQSRLKGYVSAKNKLTTRWGELKKTLQ